MITLIPNDKYVFRPSLQKVLFVTDGDYYRDRSKRQRINGRVISHSNCYIYNETPVLRLKEYHGRVSRKILKAKEPGCMLLDSIFRHNRGATPIKSQQYNCLNKIVIMTAPAGMHGTCNIHNSELYSVPLSKLLKI